MREISTCSVQANYGSVIHGPAKSLKQQAAAYRALAKADMAAVAKAKRDEEHEAYLACTTPAAQCMATAVANAMTKHVAEGAPRHMYGTGKTLPATVHLAPELMAMLAPKAPNSERRGHRC